MRIETIPLERIRLDARNPRTDGETDLDDLAASLRGVGMVQPPVLSPDGDGYRVLVGERRVRAARRAGLEALPCIVQAALDPIAAHRARVAENLHRRALNPIDHAAALRLAWLLANAQALGLSERVSALMAEERPPSATLPALESLLTEAGFHPTAPAVTWESVLDDLGVEMSAARRKKLLRVLSIPGDVQESLRQLPVTEAGARALGRLDEDDQRQVVAAIAEQPDLARRTRRIARAVYGQGYSVEEALAEARGEFAPVPPPQADPPIRFENDQAAVDAVLRFLEASNQMLSALQAVRGAAPDNMDIPDPWRDYYRDALETVREAVQ